jgi:deoxyribodipyrimidine photo-lyase
MRTIVWFRGKDLRISDHEPLWEAAKAGEVIPLFVLDPYFFAPARAQKIPHRIQFLLDSLMELQEKLVAKGSQLVVVSDKSVSVVPQLANRWGADRVVAQRWVEPFARERDRRVSEALGDRFVLYEGETLLAPGSLRTGAGSPYSVFTPFSRAFMQTPCIGKPRLEPRTLPSLPDDITFKATKIPTCEDLGIAANVCLLVGGENAAKTRLNRFVREVAASYHIDRNRMDKRGTSRLSADLKFGTISPRQVWNRIEKTLGRTQSAKTFLNELIWREFTHSSLWDRPELLDAPFRESFNGFPWREDQFDWEAWTSGRTGYPVVDASARQLIGEGFVHNRARMISASFLTKHLLISYQAGEAHYMEYLTDGDWAQNNAGWQWSAGCGCDAQPYFRIFNPVVQGKKFDPLGEYVRRWIPELADMPTKYIHRPWEAPSAVLHEASVRLGENYPMPVVEHRYARERYLANASEHLKMSKKRSIGKRARVRASKATSNPASNT